MPIQNLGNILLILRARLHGRMAVCNLACEGLSRANTTPYQAQRKLYIGGLAPDVIIEAVKKAIDDPQKFLVGRSIIVKLADSHKGKMI